MEDEAIVARDIQQQLEDLGYECVGIAARGDDAVALAGELRPDLVLMDIYLLGDMDGVAAAQEIRRRFALPVVFLTAFAEEDTLGRAARTEPHGYIIKPFSAREMHAVLEMALYKHRAEATLRSSEARNIAITQSAHDAIVTSDSAGTIVGWNHGAETIFGYTEAEVLGQAVSVLVPERFLEAHLEALERVRLGGAQHIIGKTVVVSARRKGGAEFPLELSLARWESVDGWFITAIARDTTERERAAQRVEVAAERYRTLVEWSPEPLVVHRNGVLLYANPAALRMFGVPDGQRVVGTPILDRVHPDCRALMGARVAGLADGSLKDAGMVEMKYLTMDGAVIDVETHGVAIEYDGALAVQVSLRDVTARNRAERALHESTARVSAIFEASPIGISVSRVDDGMILEVNDAALRQYGYARDEVIGHTTTELGTYAVAAQRAVVVGQLRERGSISGYALDFRRSSGEVSPMEVSCRLVELDGVACIVTMMVDLSERHRAQAETDKLEAQLQHAQKMESVGRLAGGVAHDFNNMLGVILGTTEIAMEQVDAGGPLYADLREIQRAAQRSADLTKQLLSYARRQTIAPEELNLNETVPGLLSMLQRLIGEDIRIVWQPSASLWPITMDPSQLANILTNLCINARDAIADVGTITIATENQTIDGGFCETHPEAVPGAYVRLTVRDTGSGIDSAVLAHIFEPFFTTKGVGEGTGLGLASVHGAVRQNHGFLAVSSVVGEGARFDIFLPRRGGAVKAPRLSGAVLVAASGQETILLVEDEPAILRLSARVLEAQGYAVLSANSPAEAIRLATEHTGDIHLLLTDVVMPGMNGRDLAARLVLLRPRIKYLFMSGHTAGVIAERGMLARGAALIEKPFSTRALAARVREVLDADGEQGTPPG